MSIVTKYIFPHEAIAQYVDSFWMLTNDSDEDKEIIILPDGRVDLFISFTPDQKFQITMVGIGTYPDKTILTARTKIFAISFKLLAVEYIFRHRIGDILNGGRFLPDNYWEFEAHDLNNFSAFHAKATARVKSCLPAEIDGRKRKLFKRLYETNGMATVQQLADEAAWSSRQINRYFNDYFGLSLKAYCSILRFRAAFHDIKEGKLFPDGSFADQSHFIRESKKLAGVIPKELYRNKNDRFIQFSTLPGK
jgi:AraC-like DNA-binding protein